eukprot:SAG22_NODE_1886_length_3375_cov_2.928877_1_plen_31_part_00
MTVYLAKDDSLPLTVPNLLDTTLIDLHDAW